MPKFKVLLTDYAWPSLDVERRVLAAADAELIVAATGEETELVELAPAADAILTCWKPVTAAVLGAADHCRIVSRYGVGLDNIAVDEASRLGIIVTNVPDYCAEEVSDHTLALLLACARRIVELARSTASGQWRRRDMERLRGQTLGLIGYGTMAAAVAAKANSFGLRVVAYTPRLAPEALGPLGTVTNELDEVLRRSDYVSLHVPLTAETHGLIDERTLGLMKPTAYLINTSRGGVIDETALCRALREGRIAGAALDVLTEEPPAPAHPLLELDNVIVTPHVAFYSTAAIEELERRAAEAVARALSGELPANVVNSWILEQTGCRFRATGKQRE